MHGIEMLEGNDMRRLIQAVTDRLSRIKIVDLLRSSAKQRKSSEETIDRLRATLDGEDSWFIRGSDNKDCHCECKK